MEQQGGTTTMRKLIEANHVSLGGEVGTNEWALPYLDEVHNAHATQLLLEADMLLLNLECHRHFGRRRFVRR
jgi:hypothetical protein